jgi:hypothetical protein
MAKFSFDPVAAKLRSTPKGKEASMYGPIRDIFIHVLGYPAADVDIDTAGEGGRPDVTVRAPSGLKDGRGRETKIDWIVVEAKDEHHCFTDPAAKENIFGKKSKYVGTDTAWFVMVEPCAWVLRPVAGNDLTPDADVTILIEELPRHCSGCATWQSMRSSGLPQACGPRNDESQALCAFIC